MGRCPRGHRRTPSSEKRSFKRKNTPKSQKLPSAKARGKVKRPSKETSTVLTANAPLFETEKHARKAIADVCNHMEGPQTIHQERHTQHRYSLKCRPPAGALGSTTRRHTVSTPKTGQQVLRRGKVRHMRTANRQNKLAEAHPATCVRCTRTKELPKLGATEPLWHSFRYTWAQPTGREKSL